MLEESPSESHRGELIFLSYSSEGFVVQMTEILIFFTSSIDVKHASNTFLWFFFSISNIVKNWCALR